MSDYCIKEGYQHRTQTTFLDDTKSYKGDLVFQPDVYELAAQLAKRFGAQTIIDIGCGIGKKLSVFKDEFNIIGLDIGSNVAYCMQTYDYGTWLELNLDQPHDFPVDDETLKNAVVVCSDVIEHVIEPDHLLATFKKIGELAPALLISTPERDRMRGIDDMGPPRNKKHIREWSLQEFTALCRQFELPLLSYGLTVDNNQDLEKKTILCICGRAATYIRQLKGDIPDILAIIDIHEHQDQRLQGLLSVLLAEEINIYILDYTKSGDAALISGVNRENINIERVEPATGQEAVLLKKMSIAENHPNTWIIDLQGNEQVSGIFTGMGLRDSLQLVSAAGFSSIDCTAVAVIHTARGDSQSDSQRGISTHDYFLFESQKPTRKAWLQSPPDPMKRSVEAATFPLRFLATRFHTVIPAHLDTLPRHPYNAEQISEEHFVEIISGIGIWRQPPQKRPPGFHKRLKIIRRRWKTAIREMFQI